MTVLVVERNQIVVDAAPVVRWVVGQSLSTLVRWLSKQGRVSKILLESEDE